MQNATSFLQSESVVPLEATHAFFALSHNSVQLRKHWNSNSEHRTVDLKVLSITPVPFFYFCLSGFFVFIMFPRIPLRVSLGIFSLPLCTSWSNSSFSLLLLSVRPSNCCQLRIQGCTWHRSERKTSLTSLMLLPLAMIAAVTMAWAASETKMARVGVFYMTKNNLNDTSSDPR